MLSKWSDAREFSMIGRPTARPPKEQSRSVIACFYASFAQLLDRPQPCRRNTFTCHQSLFSMKDAQTAASEIMDRPSPLEKVLCRDPTVQEPVCLKVQPSQVAGVKLEGVGIFLRPSPTVKLIALGITKLIEIPEVDVGIMVAHNLQPFPATMISGGLFLLLMYQYYIIVATVNVMDDNENLNSGGKSFEG
ncbi:hypothetical protein BDR04DRAFT_1115656 [Suillus decipiens]|nr:hypothetical protein BDR04DRAFT_1115656 [Suillus decipiens]